MKKILAGGALTAVAMAGLVAMAPTASAHNHSASASCDIVTVDLTMYPQGTTVSVKIDGVEQEITAQPAGHPGWYNYDAEYDIDPSTAHEWSVVVDSPDDNGEKGWDARYGGTTTPCVKPPTKETVVPATPEAVAGCAVTMDDVVVPANTQSVTYSKSDAGVAAALTSDAYVWPEDLGAWTRQADGSVLFPAELLLVEEECAEPTPTPSEPAPSEPAPSEPAPSAPVEEPSASPSAPAPVEEPEEPQLAATGATVGGAAAFALLLVGGGAALVIARRRMAQN